MGAESKVFLMSNHFGGGWVNLGHPFGWGEGEGRRGLVMGGGIGLASLSMCYPHNTNESWLI